MKRHNLLHPVDQPGQGYCFLFWEKPGLGLLLVFKTIQIFPLKPLFFRSDEPVLPQAKCRKQQLWIKRKT